MSARNFTNLIRDSLVNVLSRIGTSADKTVHTQFTLPVQNRSQWEAAYVGDWITRKAIDIPPVDMVRQWRAWQADKDDLTALAETEERLDLLRLVRSVKSKARLYGGAALVMGIEGAGEPTEPLVIDRVKKDGLKYLHALHRFELTTGPLQNDINSPWFGQPQWFEINSKAPGPRTRVHPSRVIRFLGNELPDSLMTGDGWGDSLVRSIDDAVKQCGMVTANIAALVHEAKVDVIKLPDFSEQVATQEYQDLLTTRFSYAMMAKGVIGAVLLDKDEEWQRVEVDFVGLPDVLRMYLLIVCGACDVPATRFLGQSPSGLSATGESDLRNYYDRLGGEQRVDLSPTLKPLDEVMLRSTFGTRPEGIHYQWNTLWQETATEKADNSLKRAQAHEVDVNAALIEPEVLREARINQLIEHGDYPGLESIAEEEEEPLDEGNAEVVAASTEPQKQALNGAQIASIKDIVVAVGAKEMPADTGKALILVSFPTMTEEEAEGIIGPMRTHEVPPKQAPPNPFARPIAAAPAASNGAGPPPAEADTDPEEVLAEDAKPRSLYVRRDVLNAKEIVAWAKQQGFKSTLPAEQMHVTITFSRAPVDWMKMGAPWSSHHGGDELHEAQITVAAGGPRLLDRLGPERKAVVLLFVCSELTWRHEEMKRAGASWDWPEYQPHVTISYEYDGDVDDVEPYRGPILLGPEIFEEVDEGWRDKIAEK